MNYKGGANKGRLWGDWGDYGAIRESGLPQANFLGAGQLSSDEQLVLIHARNQGFVNNAAVQALTGLHRADITSLLIGLRNKGFLVQESTRRWASYKLSDAIKSIDYGKPIKKTYQEKPIKKTEDLKSRILQFCRTPQTAKEIANAVGRNHIYLVMHYLTPLVKAGELVYTNPSQPKARNQKYVIAGKKH